MDSLILCPGIYDDSIIEKEKQKLLKKDIENPNNFYFDKNGLLINGEIKEITIRSLNCEIVLPTLSSKATRCNSCQLLWRSNLRKSKNKSSFEERTASS